VLAPRAIAARAICFASLFASLMPKTIAADSSPYGAFAPTGLCAVALRATRVCSQGWFGKRIAFFLRSMAVKSLAGRPVDIESLGAKMRLYPQNNVAEKRLLFTPQYFDPQERALLAERLAGDFVFLDVGASVGGYALFLAAHGGQRARILAVEPQPEIFERLVYNVEQNAFANVKAVSCALADRDGEIALFVNSSNRGETSVRVVSAEAQGTQLRVPGKSLLSLLHEEGYERLDAIKLDIEGAEDLVLDPFFRDAPQALWPGLIIMEFALLRGGAQLEQRLRALGYREVLRTVENVAYEKA
jgi:FkbM family methyltransferase